MAQPGFWDEAERAQKVVQQKKMCFQVVDPIDRLGQVIEDGEVLIELGADDLSAVEKDLKDAKITLAAGIDALEFQLMLGGPHDASNAIVTLQSGAGGVDASDFAEMMLRMYVKWSSKHDYEVLEMDYQKAEEAGIKNVTIIIKGPYAYGRMKAEQGVHRLVRISPFDGQARRQHPSHQSKWFRKSKTTWQSRFVRKTCALTPIVRPVLVASMSTRPSQRFV